MTFVSVPGWVGVSTHNLSSRNWEARAAQWLERRTRGRKVAGLSPGMRGGRTFLSRVDFVC